MTDPLTWSINLGQWAGTRVRVHVLLLLYAGKELLESAWVTDRPHPVAGTMGWLSLLLVSLALKMIVQGAMAARVGVDRDKVRLWPLGHLGGPGLTVGERSPEAVAVVIAGMATSLALALSCWTALWVARVPMTITLFGSGGAPASTFQPVWWIGWFGYINWVLFLINLIPAMPLDGGRVFRPLMAARSRDGMIGPWTAHSCAALLAVVGLVRWLYFQKPGGADLVFLAVIIEWMVRMEARMLDEGGFFE